MRYKEEYLLNTYTSPEFIECFEKLFCLHVFFKKAIYNENFKVDNEIADAIILSESGEKYFEALRTKGDDEHLAKFFLFIQFYFDELYIDVEKTNTQILERFLDKSIKNKSILFPWIYRKDLYDGYYEKFKENLEVLNAEQTKLLLTDTYQGVFQVGEYISGPLGLLKSESKRIVMPTKSIPLFHCPDPACKNLHKCSVNDICAPFPKLARGMSRYLPQKEPSEWLGFFVTLVNKNLYYDASQLNNLQKFIINSFDDSELIILFSYLVEHYKLRSNFPKTKKYKGSISDIVGKMDIAEIYQFILSKSSSDIIISIEALIAKKELKIPPTEIRKSPVKYSSGAYRIYHECNQFGIRSTSDVPDFAILTLKNVLSKLYSSDEPKKQLSWILRHDEGDTLDEKIYNLLQKSNPEKIINELIFNNPSNIENLASILPGCFNLPQKREDEILLKNRILWKLGFNPKIFPHNTEYFWSSYNSFYSLIDSIDNVGNKIDEVRAVSSNLFVALEKFLENSLSFITWVLLNDHFANTRFTFDLYQAKQNMAEHLNLLKYGEDEITFDKNGKNTLFPLSVGFNLLGCMCEKLLESKDDYVKSENEFPSFYKKESLLSFPFLHRSLVLDLKESAQKEIVLELKNVTHLLEKSNIMGVRNKLQHNRDKYPEKSELVESLTQLSGVVKNIELLGYHPNSYWKSRTVIDEFERLTIEYIDKNERKVKLELAPEYKACGLSTMDSILIVPSIQIGQSKEFIRFKATQSSNFKKLWANYPKKRKVIRKIDVEKIMPSP